MSDRASAAPAHFHCSGAVYHHEPSPPRRVEVSAVVCRSTSTARPRSAIAQDPSPVRSTFPGFRSRWKIFCSWMCASPAQTCRITPRITAVLPVISSRESARLPWASGMAYQSPSSAVSPCPRTGITLGWLSPSRRRSSRRNRRTASWLRAATSCSTFTATSRPACFRSAARNTSAKPPKPIFSSRTNRPPSVRAAALADGLPADDCRLPDPFHASTASRSQIGPTASSPIGSGKSGRSRSRDSRCRETPSSSATSVTPPMRTGHPYYND